MRGCFIGWSLRIGRLGCSAWLACCGWLSHEQAKLIGYVYRAAYNAFLSLNNVFINCKEWGNTRGTLRGSGSAPGRARGGLTRGIAQQSSFGHSSESIAHPLSILFPISLDARSDCARRRSVSSEGAGSTKSGEPGGVTSVAGVEFLEYGFPSAVLEEDDIFLFGVA